VRSPLTALRALSGRIVIAALVCALLMGAAVVEMNRYIDADVAKIPRVALTTAAQSGTGTNFLIIGSDTRSFVSNAAEAQSFTDAQTTVDGPARSDTMMVLHADGANSYAVSFPRDLWVTIPGRGDMKINAAFNDGPQKVIDTLKADFDVDVNHYLEVNFKTFQDIVNAVGDVPVYIPHVARDKLSGLFVIYPGCVPLDGQAALAWVRSRHLEYYDPSYTSSSGDHWRDASGLSDIDRIQRQQDFIRKLGAIAVRSTLDDPLSAPHLADTVIPNLTVDSGFDRAAFDQLARAFIGLANGTGRGPTFATLPWEAATRNRQDVLLVKQPAADAMLAVLRGQAPVPTPAPTPTGATNAPAAVRPVDVRVRVLNASGVQGAAGKAAEAFIRLGFPGGGTANDPRGLIDHSEVRYRPGDEAKAQLVAAAVPDAQLVADPALPGTDVVVALGKSFRAVGSAPATTVPAAPQTTLSPEQACQ
jgi:LCP family protein required for cell wall assembly